MKKFILIITIALLPLMAYSQPCPDSLKIHSQAQIDSFQINYPNCTEIEGDVHIESYDITNLNGLSALTSIGGNLTMYGNSLSSLTGLYNLISIGGNLGLFFNWGNLTNLTGLDNLTSVGGNIFIVGNDSLKNLTGLDNITSVDGGLVILGNVALSSLRGVDNLTSVEEDLNIYMNASLSSLTGLEGLIFIGNNLYIEWNEALTSLTGIDNVTFIEGLYIRTNLSLSTCEVESVCAYLANPNGEFEIHDNAIGCNSPEEVQDSCEAHAFINDKYLTIEACTISPNPFTSTTILSYTLDKPSTITISIFSPQGQLIEKIEQKQPKGEQMVQWNAEGLPAGIYYYRIQAGDKVGGGKMVKME